MFLIPAKRLLVRAYGSEIFQATAVNYFNLCVIAGTSIIVARTLGPSGRGEFAAIMAWFTLALAIGEIGQSGAITHWVARKKHHASTLIATGRLFTVLGNLVIGTVGISLSTHLAAGNRELSLAFGVAFVGCYINGYSGPLLYGTQATSIRAWNTIRLVQPLAYSMIIVSLAIAGKLSLLTLTSALTTSSLLQLGVALLISRRLELTGGKPSRREGSFLFRYGAAYASSQLPATASAQYDKAVLSQTVSEDDLGIYAVAGTVASLGGALATGISSVLFPRMSTINHNSAERNAAELRSIVLTSISTGLTILLIVASAPFIIPLVFGPEYASAITLVWWLAPAMFLHAITEVLTVLIRSRGRPGLVTWARLGGLTVGAVTILPLLRRAGTTGSALSLLALELTMVLLSVGILLGLRRRSRTIESV